MERFRQLFMRSPLVIYLTVLAVVELIVLAYYGVVEPGRLLFELVMSAIITTVAGLPAILYFIHQHRRLEDLSRRLVVLSQTDQMTGLLNRQAFIAALDARLAMLGPEESGGAFAYLDADHFKQINDRHGHATGDDAIRYICRQILAITRPTDLRARLGGEEFAIFLNGATGPAAADIAERLRGRIRTEAVAASLPKGAVSVSIGIAAHQPGQSAAELMQLADRNLYAAKHGGRDAVVIDLKKYRAA